MRPSQTSSSLPIVVIPAYQRADKLQKRLIEIRAWNEAIEIIVSIDGPRKTANFEEISRNMEVVESSELISQTDKRVTVKRWETNHGVNHHAYRFFQFVEPRNQDLIVIEDDVSVNSQALNFLSGHLNMTFALASAAHTSRNHSSSHLSFFRFTAFPMQWGVALKDDVVKRFIDFYENPKIDYWLIRKYFKKNLSDCMSMSNLEKLSMWWYQHLHLCLKNGNYADALIQYCVYSLGSMYTVPLSSLITDDVLPGDERSMTSRSLSQRQELCVAKSSLISRSLCSRCETSDSHLSDAKFRTIIGASKYRFFNPYKHFT